MTTPSALDIIANEAMTGFPQGERAQTIARNVLAALEAAGFTIEPPSPGVDSAALAAALSAVTWQPDYAPGIEVAHVRNLATILGWECYSCRVDVGWADHERAEREDGVITLTVDCGHCGAETFYDEQGEEVERV